MDPIYCVDVSEHNGDIDWNTAAEHGLEYAIIRAGFGQDIPSQDDKYFFINMDNAINAGVKVGVYFYSYAKTADQARGEAAHCIRLISKYRDRISLPVFYDCEENSIYDHVAETVPAFTNELHSAGYNVGVYAPVAWFSSCLQPVAIDFLWIAYWGQSKPNYADIWQFTDNEFWTGIGRCDLSWIEIDPSEMPALIQKPEPSPSEKDTEILNYLNDIDCILDKIRAIINT